MLNHNKRSITVNTKSETGRAIFTRLIESCDVLAENFAPGALDRMGFSWERIQEINPAHHLCLGQGLRPRSLRGLQGLRERRAVHRRRGQHHRFRRRPADRHRRPDRRFRHRAAPGFGHRHRALPAGEERPRPARRLRHAGRRAQPLPRQAPAISSGSRTVPSRSIRSTPNGTFGDATPAVRQRLGRRPARLDRQVQGLGGRPERLHLHHHPGGGVRRPGPRHRPRGLAGGSGVEHRRRRACRSSRRSSTRSRNGP